MALPSSLLEYEGTNAALGWLAVVGLLAIAIERAVTGRPLWAGLAAATAAAAVVPPLLARDPRRMVAWEVVALAGLPLVSTYVTALDDQFSFAGVAALSLVVAVELDAFTDVEMSPDFAVAFVVIVTMAVAGLWSIARFAADAALGTSFLASNEEVMWDLVGATAVGLVGGLVFELYVRRVSPGHGPPRDTRGETR